MKTINKTNYKYIKLCNKFCERLYLSFMYFTNKLPICRSMGIKIIWVKN